MGRGAKQPSAFVDLGGKPASREFVIQTFEAAFAEAEAGYAEDFAVEAASWQTELRLYAVLAEILSPKDGDIHVDFGCGPGDLMESLRRKNPNMTTIGIEENRVLAQRALARLTPLSDTGLIHNNVKIDIKAGPKVIKTFPPHVQQCLAMHRALSQNAALMIVEDMRRLEILTRILGRTPINSGSMTLPGASNEMVDSAIGLHIDPTQTMRHTVRNRLLKEARQKVDRFMTRQTARDGTYVVAERMQTAFNDNDDHDTSYDDTDATVTPKLVTDFTTFRLGDLARYWEVDEARSRIISPEEVAKIQTPLGWSANHQMSQLHLGNTPPPESKAHLAITTLVRNPRKAA